VELSRKGWSSEHIEIEWNRYNFEWLGKRQNKEENLQLNFSLYKLDGIL
jgi:hypothetical protein